MKTIAVVSPKQSDFTAYVGEIYAKSKTPKSRLDLGSKISLTEKGEETRFVLVQRVEQAQAIKPDEVVYLFRAETLNDYDKIVERFNPK